MFETTPKMLAKNHFPDIIGINLEYALDTYDWEGWNPMHLQPVFQVERLKAEGSKQEKTIRRFRRLPQRNIKNMISQGRQTHTDRHRQEISHAKALRR